MQVHLILVLVAFIWGLNPPVMKIGLIHIPAMPYSAIRLFAALTVSWLVLRRLYTPIPFKAQDKNALLIASLGFFFFHLFFTYGLQFTTAGNASLILGCLPVSIVIINHLHRFESIKPGVMKGIMLSLLGVVLIVIGTEKEINLSGNHIGGALLVLAAQISYGYFTVFSRPLAVNYSVYQVTTYVLIISTSLFAIVSLPALATVTWQTIPWEGWASVFYSGILPLCLANCLWIWATAKTGSTIASLYYNLAPVFTIAAGYLILGETFGWIQCFGAIAILAGLYLSRGDGIKSVTSTFNEAK